MCFRNGLSDGMSHFFLQICGVPYKMIHTNTDTETERFLYEEGIQAIGIGYGRYDAGFP